MSTHNICFYGELTKIIIQFQLSSNTLLICSSEDRIKSEHEQNVLFLMVVLTCIYAFVMKMKYQERKRKQFLA